MHWTTAESGAFDAERELVLIEQTPGEIVFLSAADTDLACVAENWRSVFGARLRIAHAGPLRQPVAADDYVQRVLRPAKLVIARLLGGRAYFPHLIQALSDLRAEADAGGERPQLLILPATEQDDAEMACLNDFPLDTARRFFDYFAQGGAENFRRAADAAAMLLSGKNENFPGPLTMPMCGVYRSWRQNEKPKALLCFYRAWFQTNDLAVVDALLDALEIQGLNACAFFANSLRDTAAQNALAMMPSDVILTMQSFAVGYGASNASGADVREEDFFPKFDCPVLQAPVSSGPRAAWEAGKNLPPSEIAMNVALPELDGRVMSTVVGFKENAQPAPEAEWTIKRLQPAAEQIDFVAELAANWARLRRTANAEKRVAIVLSNYPNKDGRIGNGVGLDTPASAVKLLCALRKRGYDVGASLPSGGDELMRWLQSGITHDAENSVGKPARQVFSNQCHSERSEESLAISERAGLACSNEQRNSKRFFANAQNDSLNEERTAIPISGLQFGSVFLGIQPPRGFAPGQDPQAIYHSPDLPPPPEYVAFYKWLTTVFCADAIVHLGKHGNLEWLPGRSVGLSREEDWPLRCLGATPLIYPFIVNNPGEGTQAKRRTSAVIVDHLTPPLTRAGLYAELEKMERLVEEHAHCAALYPSRAAELEKEIAELLASVSWRGELRGDDSPSLAALGNFLCEIKESQIRSGLHVLGEMPCGEKLVDFLLSLLRMPSGDRPGLLEAIAGKSVDFENMSARERDELEKNARAIVSDRVGVPPADSRVSRESPSVERTFASDNVRCAAQDAQHGGRDAHPTRDKTSALDRIADFVGKQLIPKLLRCPDEIENILRALEGKFVRSGPAGSPTRGRIDVLPTGRNFFALDPRIIPTPTAWRCGQQLAERLLERHRQETGEFLKRVALVIWGTSNMRTGGDDIAQALWLWGCEPVWENASGRVVDFQIAPLSLLGRPRVDVLLRVSGLFRDALGDSMRLLAAIPKRLAALDEPAEMNFVRAAWLRESEALIVRGCSASEASRRARLRVFSSAPGCYGTGLLPLMDAGNWETKRDLAEVFCKWGGHAFDADGTSEEEIELLKQRLTSVEAVHQNQDNREHDIFDSDDYFQFHGGLHASIEALAGKKPATYHGDSSQPERVKIRTLREEAIRVLRSRVLNPKWIAAMREHGYKGAFEMAATVDYLFGYAATCDVIESHQFEEVARALLLDPAQQEFFKKSNPSALKEAAQKMLEANERGLWNADALTMSALEETVIDLQVQLE